MLTRASLKPLAAAVAIIFTLFQIWFTAFGVLEGTEKPLYSFEEDLAALAVIDEIEA